MDGKKIHMLVVDDEKIQRDGILFLLKKSGLEFEISQCENGEEAYRLLKRGTWIFCSRISACRLWMAWN